jgi:diguanylate cyclase (GGDEF)-like protein/PAS domain S-box-containing protein
MNAVADGIITLDEQGRIESVNPSALAILGLGTTEPKGVAFERFVLASQRRRWRRWLQAHLGRLPGTPCATRRMEMGAQRLDRRAFPAEMVLTSTRLDGRPSLIVTLRDITARKQAEQLIRYQATHDALTDLPNRTLFDDRLAQALRTAERQGEKMAVLFLDLDRFKVINDTLGHAVGDALLTQVAERLRATMRKGDTIARMGGDEFILLLTGLERVEDAIDPAWRLLEALRPPFRVQGHALHLTASVGISLFPRDGKDPQTLLKNADVALYRVKSHGRNGLQLYTPTMNARAMERMLLENELRHAIGRDELVLHYQIQVDLADGRVSGAEALVRWQHPTRGLIPPDEFIPLAEECGLIVALGAWVLRAACEQDRRWRESGLVLPRLSVNMSGRQFHEGDLGRRILAVLDATGMDPHRLELELTESIVMQEDEATARELDRLLGLGVSLAMDDFGTGYSSLGYLKRLPFSRVKIDRSFIQDMTLSPGDAALVRAIVAMAHGLGLRAVAEGVEDTEQLRRLVGLDCDEAQGFLLGRPVPAADLPALAAAVFPIPDPRSTVHHLRPA